MTAICPALLFLEAAAGISFGEDAPSSRAAFDRAGRTCGRAVGLLVPSPLAESVVRIAALGDIIRPPARPRCAMPVEGPPDSSVHSICFRCGKWHYRDEGSIQAVGNVSGRGVALSALGAFAHSGFDEGAVRFVCFRCQRRHFRRRVIMYAILLALLGLALSLKTLGVLQ